MAQKFSIDQHLEYIQSQLLQTVRKADKNNKSHSFFLVFVSVTLSNWDRSELHPHFCHEILW